jgi:hypothetical protein
MTVEELSGRPILARNRRLTAWAAACPLLGSGKADPTTDFGAQSGSVLSFHCWWSGSRLIGEFLCNVARNPAGVPLVPSATRNPGQTAAFPVTGTVIVHSVSLAELAEQNQSDSLDVAWNRRVLFWAPFPPKSLSNGARAAPLSLARR